MLDWLTFNTPNNFLTVDVHSHLLPGIDDGVKSVEESLEIIQEFSALGFKKLITTPHIIKNYYPNTPKIIAQKLKELKAEIQKKNIPIELEAGAEYFVDEHFMKELEEGTALCSFGNNFVLIETGFMNKPIFLNDVIFKLQSDGYKVVLAHPERYIYLQEDYNEVHALLSSGVHLQVNALSFTGYYSKSAKKLAEYLIQHEMVNFLGSDIHNKKQLLKYKKAIKSSGFQKAGQLSLLNSAL